MTCGVVKKIAESKNNLEWKTNKLINVIDMLCDQAAAGNFRNIGVITQSVRELNLMAGHYCPVQTINVNISEDEYIKKLNATTMQLIQEKREQKLKEITNE